jgi:hypothetical protein
MGTSLVALAAQARPQAPPSTSETDAPAAPPPQFFLLSGEPAPAGRDGGRWSHWLSLLADRVAVTGLDTAASVLISLAGEVSRRRQEPGLAPAVFLFIDDLSRFRDLRKSDDDFGFGGSGRDKGQTPGQAFTEILKEGPAVGVFAVVWCDSYNNIDRWFSRQSLREFDLRVVFQVSASDSSNLIDSPAASRLGTNRALLYSDERGTIEKFRPYGPPSDEWFAWAARHLLPPAPADPAAAPAADHATAADIDQWLVT